MSGPVGFLLAQDSRKTMRRGELIMPSDANGHAYVVTGNRRSRASDMIPVFPRGSRKASPDDFRARDEEYDGYEGF